MPASCTTAPPTAITGSCSIAPRSPAWNCRPWRRNAFLPEDAVDRDDPATAGNEAPLTILHRDEHIVVIDKPANLLVHRSEIDRHETRFAIQILRDQIGRRVWPAHRLDRGTS